MTKVLTATILPVEPAKAFVGNDGIYVPSRHDFRHHEMLISKEIFVEAYNRWINDKSYSRFGEDNADDWCE